MKNKYQIYSYRVIYAYSLPDKKGLIKVADRLVSLDSTELKEAEKNPEILKMFIEDALPSKAQLERVWFGVFKNAGGERLSIKLQDVYNVLKERVGCVAIRPKYEDNPEDRDIWFKASLAEVEKAVQTAQRRESGEDKSTKSSQIIFRPEQKDAIKQTVEALRNGHTRYLWNAKMRFGKTLCALQVAKDMGYKYTLIITHRPVVTDGWEKDFNKIFTDSSHQHYGDRESTKGKKGKSFKDLLELTGKDPEGRLVFFASIQYLRGSHLVMDPKKIKKSYKENKEKTAILNFPWDMVVVDEAHEGTQSERGIDVMRYMKLNVPDTDETSSKSVKALDAIAQKTTDDDSKQLSKEKKEALKPVSPREGRPVTLSLSGTPFNLYSEYSTQEIYTWDYVCEQKAKANWHKTHGDDPNPYDVLPRLNIFNLDIEDTIGRKVLEPGESEENCTKKLTDEQLEDEYSGFNFSNFFKVWNKDLLKKYGKDGDKEGGFIHEKEIMDFFYALAKETTADSNFPFSTPEFRKAFKHTFWLIPGVPEGKALERLLRREKWIVKGNEVNNPYFKNFRVINAAGSEQDDLTGKALQDVQDHLSLTKGHMPERFRDINPDKLKKKEREEYDALNKKLLDWKGKNTITLSCGKLTTGVSVPEWNAVFYMKGNDNTTASTYMQTIFRVQTPAVIDGALKTDCYVFDFSPVRSLKVFADAVRLYMSAERGNDKTTKYSRADQKEEVKKWLDILPLQAISVPTPGSEKTRMEPYDSDKLFSQLDAKLIDRVVRSGYADNSIYDSVAIMDLAPEAEEALARISLKITADPVSNQDGGNIQMGKDKPKKPTKKQEDDARNASGKKDEDLSEEEKEAKKAVDAWNRQRRERMKTLRAMSVRIPLLMFGADIQNREELEIANFTTMIDDSSWDEFMPKNITKDDFNAVRDCYDAVRFRGSAERIREFAESSDKLSITERVKEVARIFSFFHNPDKETVLTPWRVVNMHMADTIGGYKFFEDDNRTLLDEPVKVTQEGVTDSLFITPESGSFSDLEKVHVLEINSKTGLYPLYVAYSLFRARKEHYEKAHALDPNKKIKEDHDIWEETLRENLMVVCKTPMAVQITRRTLAGFTGNQVNAICPTWEVPETVLASAGVIKLTENEVPNPDKLVTTDLVGILRAQEAIEKENKRRKKQGEKALDLSFTDQVQRRAWWEKILERNLDYNKFNNDMIKFNAVVGNPPYQEEGESTRKAPIYHLFYDAAMTIAPRVTFITPGRFLFKAGQTPNEWMNKMLGDNHFKVTKYFQRSTDVFDTVSIKGGIAIGYRDETQEIGPVGFFSEFEELCTIIKRVKGHKKFVRGEFANLVSSQGIYRFSDKALEKYPRILEVQGKGTGVKITSNSFENLPEIFLTSEEKCNNAIQLIGRVKGQRQILWIDSSYVQPCDYLDFYNVFVPEANGTGAIGEVLSTPVIGVPVIGHTDTFLSIGKFADAEEASACLKYVKSKFARCMLGTLKATQHNPKDTWANVPLQDFTENSDIDWTQSIADIDRQLYKKYELNDDEIDFIEKMIKPMED